MTQPAISLIVAHALNRTIGKDNTLPWRLPGDLAHFKQTTLGHPIIMGRKTWESLGRPLPGRLNIVISRDPAYSAEGARVASTLPDALALAMPADRVFVIGGAQVYALALDLADTVCTTEINQDVDGDAYFPVLPPARWAEVERRPQPPENGYAYDFVTYKRR
ncbi:dihydrofolate reductase [Corticimicrobacter populi]|uniref:Dihydrofolate reductase n=1 Tax=Corticimicrobacter populi TaxID=2175229 RepID=A0A2V1K3D6_9BURK|nr:dihydrofolate reductase [Corticimicrobacter populi]PWF25100.1 dihydrofolate reductase [Corticimicrobacter populi]